MQAARENEMQTSALPVYLYATQDSESVASVGRRRAPSVGRPPPPPPPPPLLPPTLSANQRDMRPAIQLAIETARIHCELSIHDLSMLTGISPPLIRAYEAGDAFPRARDIATLQAHLETQLVP